MSLWYNNTGTLCLCFQFIGVQGVCHLTNMQVKPNKLHRYMTWTNYIAYITAHLLLLSWGINTLEVQIKSLIPTNKKLQHHYLSLMLRFNSILQSQVKCISCLFCIRNTFNVNNVLHHSLVVDWYKIYR